MSGFRMTRANGIFLAAMNACVRKYRLGKFVVQFDVKNSTRFLGGGVHEPIEGMFELEGFTDRGRKFHCSVSSVWFVTGHDEGSNALFANPSMELTFGHCTGDGKRVTEFHQHHCRYDDKHGMELVDSRIIR